MKPQSLKKKLEILTNTDPEVNAETAGLKYVTEEEQIYSEKEEARDLGYMAAENCNIKEGDVIAIWGCGPVGEQGKIDPSFVITHVLPLEEAPKGYDIFKKKEDNCIKVVLKP